MFAPNRQGPFQNMAFGKTTRRLLDLEANFFVDPRDSNENGRLNLAQGLRQLFEEGAVSQGHVVVEQGIVHVAGCDMRQGQKRHTRGSWHKIKLA